MSEVDKFIHDAAGTSVGFGTTYQSIAAEQQRQSVFAAFTPVRGTEAIIGNMTRVKPKVTVPGDGQLQAKLDNHWIGCRGLEYETPHVTIISPDDLIARVRLRDRGLMPGSKGDREVIEAVQADMLDDPNKYIGNWNENNSEHAIPLVEEKQHEQQKKDESWKEAKWYKDNQQAIEASEEENTGQS